MNDSPHEDSTSTRLYICGHWLLADLRHCPSPALRMQVVKPLYSRVGMEEGVSTDLYHHTVRYGGSRSNRMSAKCVPDSIHLMQEWFGREFVFGF